MRLFSTYRKLRSATNTSKSKAVSDWSHTINLPKSTFPARASPAQLEQYRKRCSDDLYAWQRANRSSIIESDGKTSSNEFILHDGPPYANGDVHVGHALNKICKDLILRTELSNGKRVHYRPGWDCHGLPIELKALQQNRASIKNAGGLETDPGTKDSAAPPKMNDAQIRHIARGLASKTIDSQKDEFKSWAIMGEWNKPYKTMDREYELRQLQIFRKMVQNDLIFRDSRPVHWSPSSKTALAESELEYDDKHRCTAAFVKMPFLNVASSLRERLSPHKGQLYAVIWTTTPWTLPANKAIAVNGEMRYAACQVTAADGAVDDALYIVGSDRVEHVASFMPEGYKIKPWVDNISGADLTQNTSACLNLFSGEASPLVDAKFVTASTGTGLVHIAPGHGMVDYQLCQERGIGPAFAPVDDAGRYTAGVAASPRLQAQLVGLDVQTAGTKTVLDILRSCRANFDSLLPQVDDDLVLATHELVHKNPIDWRTKKPVITRSTSQWFADVSKINGPALASLKDIDFVPESGRSRLTAFVDSRSQWCISRQRAWGVPIPVIYHRVTGKENHDDIVIEHIINVVSERGTDAWFTDATDDPAWIPASLDASEWHRKHDTMDVWFDSGTSWTLIPERDGQQVSDVYLEGSDQHRGWFQSSLLTKIAAQPADEKLTAPYKKLITHGFTLDGHGRKMSKSIGNVISPSEIISGTLVKTMNSADQARSKKGRKQDPLGSDLLRLWVASCDYTTDVSVSQQGIRVLEQNLQKFRVTLRFMLGVLRDYTPIELEQNDLLIYDCMILNSLSARSKDIYDAYQDYRFYEAVRIANEFVQSDLSAFYFETVKDTLYTGLQARRRSTQAVLCQVLKEMLHWLAVVTPQLVEETWEHLPQSLKSDKPGPTISYPLTQHWKHPVTVPSVASKRREVERATSFFYTVNKAVKTAQEKARVDGKIGSGLACDVIIQLPAGVTLADMHFSREELCAALVVSKLLVTDNGVAAAKQDALGEASWQYEEITELELPDQVGKQLQIRAIIRPPSHRKCPRCWQYVAKQHDHLCSRCESAVAELS